MIGATVFDLPGNRVNVVVWDGDSGGGNAADKAIANINAYDLPNVISRYKVDEIWQDGEEMEFCHMRNCFELVSKEDPCPLCERCLEEYRQEQLDYQAMKGLRYVGVIG